MKRMTCVSLGILFVALMLACSGKGSSTEPGASNTPTLVTGVDLSPSSATLNIGGTTTLTATVTPGNATNRALNWASSNTAVATVSGGVVTGVTAGSANITATSTDGSNITSSACAVTVSNDTVQVTGITIPSTGSVTVGTTMTLTATVAPNNATDKTVTWTSDNTTVATVDPSSGVVTGVAVGSVNIKATSADGSNIPSNFCVVTVSATTTTTHQISGQVTGVTAAGVTMTLTGSASKTTTTDGSGNYAFSGLADGQYTVTPSKTGYTFTPSSRLATLAGANLSVNFVAITASTTTHQISGQVSIPVPGAPAAPVAGVTMSLTGAANATTVTDASGNYVFGGLADGRYIVTPSRSAYIFNPGGYMVLVSGGDSTVSFEAIAASTTAHQISGKVTGATVSGVTMNLTGAASANTTTDGSGNYAFSGLADGHYTVTPSKTGYIFDQASFPVILTGADFTANFAAITAGTPGQAAARIVIDEPDYYKTNKTYFPDIGITLTQGYAPFPVFFEGWQSTVREELVKYSWDFGAGTESDEMGRTFEGFNAAHVFERPGTYTVTLKVMNADGVWSAPASVTITVLSRDAKNTYYVDSSIGDDSYDGKSQTHGSGSQGPWKTATKAFTMLKKVNNVALLNPGDRVLFNREQTFVLDGNIKYEPNGVSAWMTFGHGDVCQGIQYGAYGTGSKPNIQWSGTSDIYKSDGTLINTDGSPIKGVLFNAGYGGAGLMFSDLEFNFYNGSTDNQISMMLFAYAGWKNIAWLRCTFHDPNDGVFDMEGLAPKPAGIFMVSCATDQHLTAQWAVTQIYGGPSHLAIMNSSFDEGGNHLAYLTGVDKAVISKNIFSRPAFGRTALRITGGPVGAEGNNILVSDNQFLGWVDPLIGGSGRAGGSHNGGGKRYNYLLVQFSPNGGGEELLNNIAFERNVVTNYEVGLSIANATDMTVRNNIFATPGAGVALTMNFGTANFRPLNGVSIYGNTMLSGSHMLEPPNGDTRSLVIMAPYGGSTDMGTLDTNVRFFNNIVATYSGGIAPAGLELTWVDGGFTSNNNLYDMPNVPGAKFMKQAGTAMTLNDWRTATGNDVDSIAGNPQFAGGTLTELNNMVPGTPPSMDAGIAEASSLISTLPLDAGSPAIDKGANLGAALFCDFGLNIRPTDGDGDGTAQTDIGAFEYMP